ncbi:hypothetical protein [Mesorhizobium sp. M4B.F.Ca.ET.017.02.2.1]|uniref:hypothetical protein n=1 Tax=Mesorhizobium TaxID=68287 RepID=UPI000FCA26F6|nr:hypothetical protein [Mesorhizobium sp. M4B.F.Ca.ET.017.02.2.1]RVD25453.1 hypothetical protein EN738_14060 [Mesorhizobium sp. M4B.F.Ca.ET.017.02.2.1]
MKPFAFAPCALLVMALAGPAAAQDNPDQAKASAGPCQAEPQGQGSAEQKPAADSGSDNGLTGKLKPCGGVLQPPPTGDQGMAQPAPEEGNMPVIKPGEVPPQPPKQ